MPNIKRLVSRVPFLADGRFLVGMVLLLAGTVVAREGLLKLLELWAALQPFLPLSFPEQASDRILTSLPIILKTFIAVVSSICAVLVGLVWVLSSLPAIFRPRRNHSAPPDLDQPAVVAESLRSAQALYWQYSSRGLRLLGRFWRRVRYVSPVSQGILRDVVGSLVKIALVACAIGGVVWFLQVLPELLKKFFQVRVHLLVPSAGPIYALLALLAVFDVIVAVSQVPFRRRHFSSGSEKVRIRGRGEAGLFLAMLEESCRLLNGAGLPEKRPVRLRRDDDPGVAGTLVESSPELVRAWAGPVAYICLPLAFLLITMGFSRLIQFTRPVFPMSYADFLSYHVLDYLLEVAFALALIISGGHLLEWAGKLCDIKVFRSVLVFCTLRPDGSQQAGSPGVAAGIPSVHWTVQEGIDRDFAAWARDPQITRDFVGELFWAEALSESAGTEDMRCLEDLGISEDIDRNVMRILQLPLAAGYRRFTEPAQPPGAGGGAPPSHRTVRDNSAAE